MSSETTSFWGWPGAKNFCYACFVLGPPLFLWFVLIYGGADFLTGLHDIRLRLHFDFELGIPFVPAMVVFYNSMHVAYLITPFILRTRPEMHAIAVVWFLITLCGGILFLLLPAEDAFATPPAAALGPWRAMFQFADRANLTYNSCPSLHVAWAVVCVDIFAGRAKTPGKILLWLWGLGMLTSTVLLHQHHLVDAAGGLLLAIAGSRLLYPRLRDRFRRGGH